jgi:hypothetical protein
LSGGGVSTPSSVCESVVNNYHFAAGLFGRPDAVRLADLIETRNFGRLDVEPAGLRVGGFHNLKPAAVNSP